MMSPHQPPFARRAAITSSSALVFLVSCNNHHPTQQNCTLEAEPAVVVQLTDAGTSQPVSGATITLSEGLTYSVVMAEGSAGVYSGAFERPGTYDLAISAAGYTPQTVSAITAPSGPCGPVTQQVQVAMSPTDAPVLLLLFEGAEVSVRVGMLRGL